MIIMRLKSSFGSASESITSRYGPGSCKKYRILADPGSTTLRLWHIVWTQQIRYCSVGSVPRSLDVMVWAFFINLVITDLLVLSLNIGTGPVSGQTANIISIEIFIPLYYCVCWHFMDIFSWFRFLVQSPKPSIKRAKYSLHGRTRN
jgi:hypothetical protein